MLHQTLRSSAALPAPLLRGSGPGLTGLLVATTAHLMVLWVSPWHPTSGAAGLSPPRDKPGQERRPPAAVAALARSAGPRPGARCKTAALPWRGKIPSRVILPDEYSPGKCLGLRRCAGQGGRARVVAGSSISTGLAPAGQRAGTD